MDYFQKVMWTEGLFLVPQHFQQSDRYHETLLHQRLRALLHHGWGLCSLRIDEEALRGGELVLSAASAVLPDGLAVQVPELDEPPPTRSIEERFTSAIGTLEVYLAAPIARAGSVSCPEEAGSEEDVPARYRKRHVTLNDETRRANERQIATTQKNLTLVLSGEPLDDYVCMKIAEVERSAEGTFRLRQDYVPPCLFVDASPRLKSLVRRISEALAAKSTELATRQRQRARGLVEFTMSEAANFWLLHSVNSYLPAVRHYHQQPRVHPEEVFVVLSRLAGELYTFAGEGHPRDLPAYSHDDLTATFSALESKIQALLQTVVPTKCVPIELDRTRDSLFTGHVTDERLLEASRFYLAIRAAVPEDKISGEVPLKAKVSSSDQVDRLIRQALRGLPLKHLPTPPAEIPVLPGRSYFEVDRTGEHWEAVRASRTLSIYLPPEFTDLKLELLAVRE